LLTPLPIDNYLSGIVDAVRSHRSGVIVAPPGSGKTTRVPPAFVGDGAVLLLQPRRVAARNLARRIAGERGWTVGEEIGWQVRHERRFGKRTRLLVATEGVLTARLQSDPLLEAFRTVVLDEFHERSLHADLALALVREAARAREDLAVVVMSATLDEQPVSDYLDGCPVLEVHARTHPVEIVHAPHTTVADGCRESVAGGSGHTLCFLPGAPEIHRTARDLQHGLPAGVDVLPLYGALDAAAQDAAVAPSPRRKLILATNVAETSLTVDGVDRVVDSGWHKVLRRDATLGIDRLERERISLDSAEQRAGRSGRTGPGLAMRLWESCGLIANRRSCGSIWRLRSSRCSRGERIPSSSSGSRRRSRTRRRRRWSCSAAWARWTERVSRASAPTFAGSRCTLDSPAR
jgi:ATP-dependent helicase HrpB